MPNTAPLTQEQLTSRFWSFSEAGQPPIARYLKLLPGGRIAGLQHDHHKSWVLKDNGSLAFLDCFGQHTALFTLVETTPLNLSSRETQTTGTRYELHETPALGQICSSKEGVNPASAPKQKRRNLVIVRANEQSLHTTWPQDLAAEDRDWDLCISYYGDTANFPPKDFAEYHVLQNTPTDRKYNSLYHLLHHDSLLLDYDYIAMPDDDLMMSWKNLNELFIICREYNLQLAQPALTPNSQIMHRLTRQNTRYLLRYTSFVEIMAPFFSREALLTCLPTFPDSRTGFGLDHVWPRLIGEPVHGLAIIDRVAITHARPVGTNYILKDAIAEGLTIEQRYGVKPTYLERGGIFAEWLMPPKT